jgi:putative FmdB family regulatory protein
MPVYELTCDGCVDTQEVFLHHWDSPNPACERCGGPRRRLMSCFASPFMGSLRKYSDLRREGAQAEGFWAYKKRSSVSGQPEPVFLSSVAEVRDFNRAEGLAPPGEIPVNATISADGRRIVSDGMPGNWRGNFPPIPARLQQIIDLPADQIKQAPATCTPSMPSDYGVRVEAVEATAEVGG